MQKVIVKIPRKKQKLRVIRNKELLEEQLGGRRSPFEPKPEKQVPLEPEPDEVFLPLKRKSTQYTEYFSISNSKEPVQISLKNIPPESITVNEAKIEIQRAYEQGFEDGRETASSEYKAEIRKYEEWIRQIDSVILELKDKFLTESSKFERVIIETAQVIAEQILDREVSSNSDIVIEQVKKAIASLDDDIIFSIHLHPEDVEILEQAKSLLTDDKKRLENVKIVPDRSIGRGGGILHSAAGNIDARIKTQIQNSADRLRVILNDHIIEEADIKEASPELHEKSMKMNEQIASSDFDQDEDNKAASNDESNENDAPINPENEDNAFS